VFSRVPSQHTTGKRYTNGTQAPPIGSPLSGTFTAIDSRTNNIAWQHKLPYRMCGGGGSTVTAGGLLLRGEPDGNFVALDAKTGETLWKFQTGFGADAPAMVYEIDGDQYVAIVTGGNSIQGSAYGDAVWAFSLKGQLGPLWPPPPPVTIAGPGGAVAEGVDKVKIADNNVEYSYWPARIRVKAGTTVTFTNVGDVPHTATAFDKGKVGNWDTGALAKGEEQAITFSEPGIHYYICSRTHGCTDRLSSSRGNGTDNGNDRLSGSKATRDLLKSFGWGIRALDQLDAATMAPFQAVGVALPTNVQELPLPASQSLAHGRQRRRRGAKAASCFRKALNLWIFLPIGV
jgi:plastocyanin